MTIKYSLSRPAANALAEASEQLRVFIDTQRNEREEKSEKWQEGDKAQAHEAWLDELEQLCDSLDDPPTCEA